MCLCVSKKSVNYFYVFVKHPKKSLEKRVLQGFILRGIKNFRLDKKHDNYK
jgi:hypothetical protein